MKINNENTEVVFSFKPKDYFLVFADDELAPMKWSLNYRIDRSEKGKDDDVGIPIIYLSEGEANQCKKAGFTEVHI